MLFYYFCDVIFSFDNVDSYFVDTVVSQGVSNLPGDILDQAGKAVLSLVEAKPCETYQKAYGINWMRNKGVMEISETVVLACISEQVTIVRF